MILPISMYTIHLHESVVYWTTAPAHPPHVSHFHMMHLSGAETIVLPPRLSLCAETNVYTQFNVPIQNAQIGNFICLFQCLCRWIHEIFGLATFVSCLYFVYYITAFWSLRWFAMAIRFAWYVFRVDLKPYSRFRLSTSLALIFHIRRTILAFCTFPLTLFFFIHLLFCIGVMVWFQQLSINGKLIFEIMHFTGRSTRKVLAVLHATCNIFQW